MPEFPSFLWLIRIQIYIYKYHIVLLVCLLKDTGFFHILAVVNSASMYTGLHTFFLNWCFYCLQIYTQEWNHWLICFSIFSVFFSFVFLGPHPRHLEVPRLGVQSELRLPGLHHRHSNARSKLCLQPTPHLTAMPDP